ENGVRNSQNLCWQKLFHAKNGEYEMWEIRIKQYFQIQDYALWEVIENGNSWVPIPVTTPESGSQLVHEDLEQLHDHGLEEMDLKWNIALLKDEIQAKCYHRTFTILRFKLMMQFQNNVYTATPEDCLLFKQEGCQLLSELVFLGAFMEGRSRTYILSIQEELNMFKLHYSSLWFLADLCLKRSIRAYFSVQCGLGLEKLEKIKGQSESGHMYNFMSRSNRDKKEYLSVMINHMSMKFLRKFYYTECGSCLTPTDLEKPWFKEQMMMMFQVTMLEIHFIGSQPMEGVNFREKVNFLAMQETKTVVATFPIEADYCGCASCCGSTDLLTKGFDAGRFLYLAFKYWNAQS
ncbi:hypothetical protein Tco_0487323, partial [Tanacetum coccineum]